MNFDELAILIILSKIHMTTWKRLSTNKKLIRFSLKKKSINFPRWLLDQVKPKEFYPYISCHDNKANNSKILCVLDNEIFTSQIRRSRS